MSSGAADIVKVQRLKAKAECGGRRMEAIVIAAGIEKDRVDDE